MGHPVLGFYRGERFFALTIVGKVHYNPSTVLTFRGKLIVTRIQRLLFEESSLQPVDGAYFLGEVQKTAVLSALENGYASYICYESTNQIR